MIKIGITEKGDAGLDFSWVSKLVSNSIDGTILVTKGINAEFIDNIVALYKSGKKGIIVHCTCTGFGGTILEPNVPDYTIQLDYLKVLIDAGFPKENCVLRIDPILPIQEGFDSAAKVITYASEIGLIPSSYDREQGVEPNLRIRVSVMDEYNHVKERLIKHGLPPIYLNGFQASDEQLINTIEFLAQYDITFECCAENRLYDINRQSGKYNYLFDNVGCISEKDLVIMKIDGNTGACINPQNRNGCQCLSCKTELLKNKHQCSHGCLYCYWR